MKRTPLYNRHVALGATMTEFGGWAMPVQYSSVIDEHKNTRTLAGLFDVCHMGELELKGPQALDLLQWVMSRDLAKQKTGEMKLSAMTNEKGGIIDDVTIYKRGDEHYMVVTNAATKDGDLDWILKARQKIYPARWARSTSRDRLRRRFSQKSSKGIFRPCNSTTQWTRALQGCLPWFREAVTPARMDSRCTLR
jgi:glycine cleavage system aminomethyltransferase T